MVPSHKLAISLTLLTLVVGGCDAVRPIPEAGDSERVVEMACFEGGYGIGWHKKIAEQYSKERAADNVRVDLWGDPRVVDKVKPRLLRGDPPDVMIIQWMPVWLLIAAGKLLPFNEALNEKAYGSDARWGELFVPGTLDAFSSDGQVYAIPSSFAAWSCWYNARMFREHGWQPPKTWGEFDALCDTIRAAGIAPLAFQGKYPAYAWFTYVSLIQRVGGLAALNRVNGLEPGAFTQPAAVRAAELLQNMATRHFQRGAMAMTHTESQLQFVNGQVAMIWCGIWLENEMKNSTPPGFEMRCFSVPAVEGGKGNPRLFLGSGAEWLHVTADGREPEAAFDFCRYLVSPLNAPDMGASIGVISPLRGGTPRESVSPALQSVLDMIDDAPGIFSERPSVLLPQWNNEVLNPGLSALLRGETTPEVFCKALDDGIAAALSDPDLMVPTLTLYDPAKYGEQP